MTERPVEHTRPSGRQVVAVLLGSGAIGFFLGLVHDPAAPDVLEPAQVLAGVVQYPSQSPVYIYSTRAWTVLHQVLALLLHWGFSERTLSQVISGVVGMVSLQALAVLVLAFSRDVWPAILAPFFIYFTNAASGGVTYPVALMGASHTYGILGLSYMVLAMALLGAGHARWGALLLGFGPAIHLTIGAWGIAIVAIAIGIDAEPMRQWAKRTWPYFLAGVAASVLSATIHYFGTDDTDPALYLAALAEHWDYHRQPFSLVSGHTAAAGLSTGLVVLWMSRFRHDVPPHARVLLRILIVAAVLGGTLSISYWIVPATVPNVIPALMPSRLLNFSLFTCMAFIIGVSGCYRSSVWIQSNLAALVLVVLILCLGSYVTDSDRARVAWAGMGVSGLTLALLAELRRQGVGMSEIRPRHLKWLRRTTWFAVATALAAVCGFAVRDFEKKKSGAFADWTTDPLLATAARRPGLLLTAGDLTQIQLVTRRPVLLNTGALDALAYVPDAAPETDRILRHVYGTDLLSIQQAHAGALTADTGKAVWEARSPAEWQQIGREFGVTDVLTYPGWMLQLPVIVSSAELILYEIPFGH